MPVEQNALSPDIGILSYGAYIPRRRLQRSAIHAANAWYAPELRRSAKGEKAIGNWDEDTVTMAVEAGRDCLKGFHRETVDSIRLASTTLPNADRLNAGIVKEALTLSENIEASDAAGSQRASTSALLQALESQKNTLVLSADQRRARVASAAEMSFGEAAAGVMVGTGKVIAKCIARHSVTVDFVDHFRASDEKFDYDWEARWVRDEGYLKITTSAIRDALTQNEIDASSIHHTAIAIPVGGVPKKIAQLTGLPAESIIDNQIAAIGNTGAAYPLMQLVSALESCQQGERILLVSFGQGVDVLVFEATDEISHFEPRMGVSGWLASREEDSNYQRYLTHRGLLEVETGMRAEVEQKQPGSTLYRHRKGVMGLVGGRCTETGTVQFPKTDITVSQNSRAQGTQEDYPLAERPAKVVTFTSDNLTYTPDPPAYYGNVDFEGGGRMMADFTDVGPNDVKVGSPMRMVFRIKAQDKQRGFTKYFWKAAPQPHNPRKGG